MAIGSIAWQVRIGEHFDRPTWADFDHNISTQLEQAFTNMVDNSFTVSGWTDYVYTCQVVITEVHGQRQMSRTVVQQNIVSGTEREVRRIFVYS
jgi:hypothetical protein